MYRITCIFILIQFKYYFVTINLVEVKPIFLFFLIGLPFQLHAQNENKVDNLSLERSAIIKKIDSLERRLVEIDEILTNAKTENKLEAMISKYGKNKGKLIANGKVWVSISAEMALDSWGKPEKIQKSEVSSGLAEKWSYSDGRYLFFKNKRLESWNE